jgi:energy-coupling factor transporter ATP-binding protein EcfA2
MVFLKRILINGFKSSSKSIQINFSEKQSSVIFGNNGCGKTTFLKILNAIFKQDDSVLIEEEVDSIAIDYTTSNSNEHQYKKISKTVKINKIKSANDHSIDDDLDILFSKRVDYHFDWNNFANSELANCKSLSLGVDRGSQSTRLNINSKILVNYFTRRQDIRINFKSLRHIHEFSDDLVQFLRRRADSSQRGTNSIDFEADHVFLKEINMDNVESTLLGRYRNARRSAAKKIQNALFDTLASAITEQNEIGPRLKVPLPRDFNDIIFKNKDLLIEALDDKTENSFKDRIVKELRKIMHKTDVAELKENTLLSKLLIEMASQLKDTEAELSAINTVIERFDFFTGDSKQLIINANSLKVRIGKNNHSISKLSSGERHILTLFTLLLDQGRHRDFIIIDEPEISLNAVWQEALLPTLEELLPNCQIIVASHSALLAESVDNLAELEVVRDEDELDSSDDDFAEDDSYE